MQGFKNKTFKDFIYIILVQGLNYLVPLFLTPIVVRRLGPENYGVASFSQSFAQYFTLIVNFGFDLSAVRQMAILKENNERSQLFSDVFCAKLFLFTVSFVLFFFLNFTVDKFKEYSLLNLISFLINLGYLFYPSWFFQAVGKMRLAVIINCFFKIFMAVSVILLVTSESDFAYYNLSISISQILLGLTGFLWVIHKYGFKINLSFKGFTRQIKGSLIIFVSQIVINLYTNTNIFLLGIFSNHEATGYFAGSSKLVYGSIYLIFVPFSLILYPKISAALKENEQKGIAMLKQSAWIALAMGASISLLLFIGSETIIKVVYGEKYLNSVVDFRILSALPFLLALSNIFVTQGMINLKMDKLFLTITTCGAVLCLLINCIFIPYYHDVAAAYALVITELFITVIGYILLKIRIGNIFEISDLKYLIFSFRNSSKINLRNASH